MTENAEYLNRLGRCIEIPDDPHITIGGVSKMIESLAMRGKRIIVVDPITAAGADTDKCWKDDELFIRSTMDIIKKHGVSLVLVTHPRKGSGGKPSLDEISGGAAYARFTQCVLWIDHHSPPKQVDAYLSGNKFTDIVMINRTVKILKARNAKGTKINIGYNLDARFRFVEVGIIENKK